MAFKEVLPNYLAKVYKHLDKDELKEFGVKKKDDNKFVQKSASFDGDSFDEFLNRAEEQRTFNRNGRAGFNKSYDDSFLGSADKATGREPNTSLKYANPEAAALLEPFATAGIPKEEIPSLAREANIGNFNRPKEAAQMLKAYLNKHTSQKELDGALSNSSAREKDEPSDRPSVREDLDPNRDLPPISERVIAAQERLDNPLIPLYEGQDDLRDDPKYAGEYRDHFITQNFLGENGLQPNRMLGLYNAMNVLS